MERQRTRPPTHPGEILQEEFLSPAHITQAELARHIGCDVKTINRLVNGHTSVSIDLACRLAAALSTTPVFWLNLQNAHDLFEARQARPSLPEPMKPFRDAS